MTVRRLGRPDLTVTLHDGGSYVQLCGSAVEWKVAGSGPMLDSLVGEWIR